MKKAGWNTFLSSRGEEVVKQLGEPKAILIELPFAWKFARESEEMPVSAEQLAVNELSQLTKVGQYTVRRIGGYGSDYRYFGIWNKVST